MNNKKVKCPYCKKPTIYSLENPFRPFCSERCRLLDLGAWASEDYKVATEEVSDFQSEQVSESEFHKEKN